MSWLGSIRVVLIDLSGTLHVGDEATPGAVRAFRALRAHGDRVRIGFCSNTTKESSQKIVARLQKLDMKIDPRNELTTPLVAAAQLAAQLAPRAPPTLLLAPSSAEEYLRAFEHARSKRASEMSSSSTKEVTPEKPDQDEPDACVVMGLDPVALSYPEVNRAFRALKRHPKNVLIAANRGLFHQDVDKELSIGVGPFVTALEEATKRKAHVVGKPSRGFFRLALSRAEAEAGWEVGSVPSECVVMIGDDVRDDVRGAKENGYRAVLVKTGKYREGDELSVAPEHRPDLVVRDIGEFVDQLLLQQSGASVSRV